MDANWAMNDRKSQNREHFTRQATNIFGGKTNRTATNNIRKLLDENSSAGTFLYVTHAFSWISLCQPVTSMYIHFDSDFAINFLVKWIRKVDLSAVFDTMWYPPPTSHPYTHVVWCHIKLYVYSFFVTATNAFVVRLFFVCRYQYMIPWSPSCTSESLWCQSPMDRVMSLLRFYIS